MLYNNQGSRKLTRVGEKIKNIFMKLVSSFEILLNRIAPFNPTPSGAVARKVLQGHFLTISNTELHRSVYFKVKYTYSNNITVATDPVRELNIAPFPGSPTGNAVLIYDGGSINNQVIPLSETTKATGVNIPGGDYFVVSTRNLRLRAGETGLLTLLPYFQNIGENSLTDTTPSLEVRGHISIEQVSESTYVNSDGQSIVETNPYVKDTAKLLISSEHRGTFLDEDFNGTSTEYGLPGGIRIGFDFDQLAYSLPLAEGKSLYELASA
jgi:hypothetical protein